ncbi:MAG: hypothetical protein KAH20_16375 [Methylococcales bacterium]|nr:hypothetical protein [Methylococcales bacterium]
MSKFKVEMIISTNYRVWGNAPLFFISLILAIFSLTSQVQAKQYGIAFVDYTYDGYLSEKSDRELERLASTGVEWTNILVSAMSDTIDSTEIYRSQRDGRTPSDEAVIHAIKKAQSLGLKVMLYPHLDLVNDPKHWFGEVGKNFNSQQWDAWFRSYTGFLLYFAKIAEQNNVEQLSIGMELMYAEKHEASWRKLISIIRQHYSGTLIYAENYATKINDFDNSNVRWWDALDYIGIDAYYDLIPETNKNPTLNEMLVAWRPIVKRLERYSKKWNKPILFPEMGYRSVKGSTHHPWSLALNRNVDLQEQKNAYKAFYKSFANKPWFAGVFWWTHSAREELNILNTSYSPIGKPAEEVIRQYLYSDTPDAPVCDVGVDPKMIKAGEKTALWWWSENLLSANINNGVGRLKVASNYKWLSPTKTTTYTMDAKGEEGKTTCKTTVTVNVKKNPVMCELGADPWVIKKGEKVALWWWTRNARSASIDHGINQIKLPSHYKWFSPSKTTTYKLSVKDENGKLANCKTTITVK